MGHLYVKKLETARLDIIEYVIVIVAKSFLDSQRQFERRIFVAGLDLRIMVSAGAYGIAESLLRITIRLTKLLKFYSHVLLLSIICV